MELLSIMDFFYINNVEGSSGTDWLAVLVGAVVSALVAWLTVYLTLAYQKTEERRRNIVKNYNKRVALIELNSKVYLGYVHTIKILKKSIRKFQFKSNRHNTVYLYNNDIFRAIESYDFETLFEIIEDINFTKEERKLVVNYKICLKSIYDALDTLSKTQSELADEILKYSQETDLFLTETLSELQKEMFSVDGFQFKVEWSSLFPLKVIKNEQDAAKIRFMKSMDQLFSTYQSRVTSREIRTEQMILLKGLLLLVRKYQRYKFIDVLLAQKIMTSISMINQIKVKYSVSQIISNNYKELVHKEMSKISEFATVLKRKHRKFSKEKLLKSVKVLKYSRL